MKNELLRLYNKYLIVDPDEEKLESGGILNRYNVILGKCERRKDKLNILHSMFKGMLDQILFSKSYSALSKPISGRKALVDPGYEFFAYLEGWWPSVSEIFDFSRPSLLPCISEICKSRFGCSISDLPDTYTGESLMNDIVSDLKDYVSTQEWFGFNMGDKYNFKRTRPIKKRRLRFDSLEIRSGYRGYYALVCFIDKDGRDKVYISPGYGWELYYSEELMNERLRDIESFWIGRYDSEVQYYDDQIKKLQKQLKEAKEIRNISLGKATEFQKKIKNILWKDF